MKKITELKWKTEKRKVDDLLPYEKNPRRIGTKEKMELERSIKKFGLVEIPAINTDNKIVAGHQRLKIMQLLGRGKDTIDVRVPNRKLTKQEFEEYLLRLNKNTGDFDFEILGELGEDLLREVGFNDSEIKRAIEGIGESRAEEEFTTEVLEENNYIVFTFDNSVDWLQVSEFFNLKTVQAKDSKKDYRRKGVGRVLDGKRLQELIDKI